MMSMIEYAEQYSKKRNVPELPSFLRALEAEKSGRTGSVTTLAARLRKEELLGEELWNRVVSLKAR